MEVGVARFAVVSLMPKFPTGDTRAVFGDNKTKVLTGRWLLAFPMMRRGIIFFKMRRMLWSSATRHIPG